MSRISLVQLAGSVKKSTLNSRFICSILPSMVDVGACWDNAVVERFLGSLKHDWILKAKQPTREHMKLDVAQSHEPWRHVPMGH
jgi:transposase InsO family protein